MKKNGGAPLAGCWRAVVLRRKNARARPRAGPRRVGDDEKMAVPGTAGRAAGGGQGGTVRDRAAATGTRAKSKRQGPAGGGGRARRFDGRVQQRMERTLGAITPTTRRRHPRASVLSDPLVDVTFEGLGHLRPRRLWAKA